MLKGHQPPAYVCLCLSTAGAYTAGGQPKTIRRRPRGVGWVWTVRDEGPVAESPSQDRQSNVARELSWRPRTTGTQAGPGCSREAAEPAPVTPLSWMRAGSSVWGLRLKQGGTTAATLVPGRRGRLLRQRRCPPLASRRLDERGAAALA